jgi:hypothetical protein
MRIGSTRLARATATLGATLLLLAGDGSAVDLEAPMQVRRDANVASAKSQERIDGLSDQTERLVAEYRTVLDQIESLRTYNRQMEELVASQQEEMESLREQIDQVEVVARGVLPLMLRMIEALGAFVEADVPFLLEERRSRVVSLEALMDRADVSNAEKFRRILEAYQTENDFGRTIEAYRGDLAGDGETRIVDFLRVGRIGLFYLTEDGSEAGTWDRASGGFVELGRGARSEIRQGLRIARKQAAPDLLRLPLPAPEEAR